MTESSLPSIVKELGPAFQARAAASDQSGAFVSENYAAMKAKKLFSAGVPKDLGGGGASHAELADMLRALAHYCPSTALALSMHSHLVAAACWRHLHGQPAAPLLTKVAQSELVLVSTGAKDWLDSTGTATRVEGGYRVTAQKAFASGSPVGDMLMTSAPYDDPQEGALVLQMAIPMKSEGVRSNEDWDTLGMRATGSHTLTLDNVFVPDAAVAMKRPRGQWHPFFNVICVVALPLVVSVYVGVAEAAAELARQSGRKRPTDPHLPYTLGEMENALTVAQMALREMVQNCAGYDFAPEVDRANESVKRKSIAAEACERCVKKAVEASGGSAFFRKNPLERLSRDIQAVHFHPMPEKKQLLFTGRLALGLPPT